MSAPSPTFTRPELLAPAGDWDCVRAAVENGADAIYFGLERFNARMRAKNFTQADLPALMAFLHRRGVRGYVTFNTLVFTSELADAADYLRGIIASGRRRRHRPGRRHLPPDPAALARLSHPRSTQMTVTSAAGVEFARQIGAHLVVLARENSIADITSIQTAQTSPRRRRAPALPLEVFRPRRALRGLFRPVPDQRVARRPLRQPRRMRPGLPHALRSLLGWQEGRPRRPQVPAQPPGSRRTRVLPDLIRAGVASSRSRAG
jgi:hypothetical protein